MPDSHKSAAYRETCRNILMGIMAPAILWATVVWAASAYGNASGTREMAMRSPAPAETLQQAGQQDFISAWARLDAALAGHGYENAQTVLRRVRDENAARGVSVCSFEWNQGQISLVYSAHTGSQGTDRHMGQDMSNCANAVEKEESSQ